MIDFCDKPQHVLVTGGTGFIGPLLVNELLDGGHRVTLLTRHAERARAQFTGRVRCLESLDALADSSAVDVVVNLAGARILGARWTHARQLELLRSRVGLTQDLVAWIARARPGPALLLSASAIGYYGVQRAGDDSELAETSPPQQVFMSQLCQQWEAAAARAAEHGVRVACLRFGLVLGHGGALPLMLLPIRLGLGGRLGSGRQWVSWIHVHDLLRAMAHVWRINAVSSDDATGTSPAENSVQSYNFTAPQAVTQLQFNQIAGRVLQRPVLLPTPGWPMRLALGEQSDLLLQGQRVAPVALQQCGFEFEYPDLQAALADICGT